VGFLLSRKATLFGGEIKCAPARERERERETQGRERKMQDPAGASGGGGGGASGGANEFSRVGGGLARFRSAPTTWLDALLEDDDSLKLSGPHHPGGLTELLTAGTTSPDPGPGPSGRSTAPYVDPPAADPGFFARGGGGQSNVAFHRMNSSPADFLSGAVDGYFSSFGNIPASYDFAGSSVDVSPVGKRLRDADSDQASPSFNPHRVSSGEYIQAKRSCLFLRFFLGVCVCVLGRGQIANLGMKYYELIQVGIFN